MARQQSDREDLLREATALRQRAELALPGSDEPLTFGFRQDGALSLFFGADPVYQFNAAGQLRRIYAGGLLYKAELGRLVRLTRERTESEVALVRHELSDAETAVLLADLARRIDDLRQTLAVGSYQVLGQVPADADLVPLLGAKLAELPLPPVIAARPNVG
jgi:hypothetical protein